MNSFSGVFTPLITPLDANDAPDLDSLNRLVEWQIEQGIQGLWAMGTTSEFASFSAGERASVVARTIAGADRRVPVIANISDASTVLCIEHGRRAEEVGADAVAATPPYYFPHSQDELLEHYRQIRQAIDLPVFVYNIPQTVRTKVELTTMRTLLEEGIVAGIKDSQNDLEYFRQLHIVVKELGVDFSAFAGTRYLIDAAVLCGADGVIPSIANAFPSLCVEAFDAACQGDFGRAARHSEEIVSIESTTSLVANGSRHAAVIGMAKTLLYRMEIISMPRVRSPLRNFDERDQKAVWDALASTVREHVAAGQMPLATSTA